MNILVFTSQCFFILSIIAFIRNQPVYAIILLLNFVTSSHVHIHRHTKITPIYLLDLFAIFLWFLFNAYTTFYYFTIDKLIMALLVFITNIIRIQDKYKSKKRQNIHFLMHVFGIIGSYFVIRSLPNYAKSFDT